MQLRSDGTTPVNERQIHRPQRRPDGSQPADDGVDRVRLVSALEQSISGSEDDRSRADSVSSDTPRTMAGKEAARSICHSARLLDDLLLLVSNIHPKCTAILER